MKKCSKCLTEKAVTEYNISKISKDGFAAWCRDCQHAYYKVYNASRKDAKASVVVDKKVCKDCGLEKPISQFGKRSISLDKHNIYCKPCWRIRTYAAEKKMKQNGK